MTSSRFPLADRSADSYSVTWFRSALTLSAVLFLAYLEFFVDEECSLTLNLSFVLPFSIWKFCYLSANGLQLEFFFWNFNWKNVFLLEKNLVWTSLNEKYLSQWHIGERMDITRINYKIWQPISDSDAGILQFTETGCFFIRTQTKISRCNCLTMLQADENLHELVHEPACCYRPYHMVQATFIIGYRYLLKIFQLHYNQEIYQRINSTFF